MRFFKIIGYTLYYGIGFYLPNREIPVVGRLCSWFRGCCFRLIFGSECGKLINIQRRAYFGFNNQISMGSHSGLGSNFHLQNTHLAIGKDVIIAPNVSVLGGGHCSTRTDIPIREQGVLPKSNLAVGDDVWIGRNVTILGKVKRIGNHSIIGACSVVTHDVPDYSVVAGNPARVIQQRNHI